MLYKNRIESVKGSIEGNRAEWVMETYREIKKGEGLKKANEFLKDIDMDKAFPFDNAHYSNTPLFYRKKDFNDNLNVNIVNSFVDSKGKTPFLTTDPTPGYITLGKGYEKSAPTVSHEVAHSIQKSGKMPIDDELRGIISNKKRLLPFKEVLDESYRLFSNIDIKNMKESLKNISNLEKDLLYFLEGSKGKEPYAYLREFREALLEKGLIKNTYDEITPQILKEYKKMKEPLSGENRLFYITAPWDYKKLASVMNKAPMFIPAAGLGAGYRTLNNQQSFENGGLFEEINFEL